MPSPLGEGQTVTPINRHHQGEVPCGHFAGEVVRRKGGAGQQLHSPITRSDFHALSKWIYPVCLVLFK